jgi:hypothetical protein
MEPPSVLNNRPDFFIVGAAKSATTSMYEYLRQHPQVFMPDRPEMSYFGRDLLITNRIADLDTYLSHFSAALPHQRIGEKSVIYLYSELAAAEIRDFNPASQIIIMLRNPVDMMFSLHKQSLYSANEDIVEFESALDAEGDRQRGRRIPSGAHNPGFLRYRSVASYASQVKRYIEALGRERVHVIVFEEFVASPARLFAQAVDFLGLEPLSLPDFDVHNPRKRVPNVRVRKFMKTHPRFSKALNRQVPLNLIDAARDLLAAIQRQPAPKMDPSLRKTLLQEFRSEIDAIEELVKRDLSVWHAG